MDTLIWNYHGSLKTILDIWFFLVGFSKKTSGVNDIGIGGKSRGKSGGGVGFGIRGHRVWKKLAHRIHPFMRSSPSFRCFGDLTVEECVEEWVENGYFGKTKR